jgi:hypothetical protein
MGNLAKQMNSFEREQTAKALDKLFVCQDRPQNKEKIVVLVNQIAYWPYSLEAVIAGIESLSDADLKRLSLSVIRDAIRAALKPKKESTESTACRFCGGNGTVCLVNPKFPGFPPPFACVCDSGKKIQEKFGLAEWNGELKQVVVSETWTYLNGEEIQKQIPDFFERQK